MFCDLFPFLFRMAGDLNARLASISSEAGSPRRESRGEWLEARMQELRTEEGITDDTVPTPELIKRQILLPSSDAPFSEPIKQWEAVPGPPKLPGFRERQSTEGEEELVLAPPGPTHLYIENFDSVKDPVPQIAMEEVPQRKEEFNRFMENVLNNNSWNNETEVAVYDHPTVIRLVAISSSHSFQ